jgi:hypothetical protein
VEWFQQEAPVGVEPTMADLQSAALATWLRRLIAPDRIDGADLSNPTGGAELGQGVHSPAHVY